MTFCNVIRRLSVASSKRLKVNRFHVTLVALESDFLFDLLQKCNLCFKKLKIFVESIEQKSEIHNVSTTLPHQRMPEIVFLNHAAHARHKRVVVDLHFEHLSVKTQRMIWWNSTGIERRNMTNGEINYMYHTWENTNVDMTVRLFQLSMLYLWEDMFQRLVRLFHAHTISVGVAAHTNILITRSPE